MTAPPTQRHRREGARRPAVLTGPAHTPALCAPRRTSQRWNDQSGSRHRGRSLCWCGTGPALPDRARRTHAPPGDAELITFELATPPQASGLPLKKPPLVVGRASRRRRWLPRSARLARRTGLPAATRAGTGPRRARDPRKGGHPQLSSRCLSVWQSTCHAIFTPSRARPARAAGINEPVAERWAPTGRGGHGVTRGTP